MYILYNNQYPILIYQSLKYSTIINMVITIVNQKVVNTTFYVFNNLQHTIVIQIIVSIICIAIIIHNM